MRRVLRCRVGMALTAALLVGVTGAGHAQPTPAGSLVDLAGGTRLTAREAQADRGDKLTVRYVGRQENGLETVLDPRCPASTSLAIATDRQVPPVVALDCAKWTVSGSGYRYVEHPEGAGSLRRIVYRPGRLVIRLSGAPYSDAALTGPVQFVQTRFLVNDGAEVTEYCGRWQEPPSEARRNDPERVVLVGPSSACDAQLLFQSSFEASDPFPPDGSGWSNLVLQTPSGQPKARFEVRTDRSRTGGRSAWFFAPPGGVGPGESCGKASVIRRDTVRIGETVRFSASYWLADSPTVVTPQLMDVECSPAECGYVGSPGVRVVTTRDGRLRLDWKFLNWYRNQNLPTPPDAPPTSPRSLTPLPVREWFRLTLRMVLGEGDAGLTEVYVDDRLEISVRGTNMAPAGMEQLTRYTGVELGITCNPSSATQSTSLYVDDVVVERER